MLYKFHSHINFLTQNAYNVVPNHMLARVPAEIFYKVVHITCT